MNEQEVEFWRRLEEQGLWIPPKEPRPAPADPFQPIKVSGKPLSETIIEDRR